MPRRIECVAAIAMLLVSERAVGQSSDDATRSAAATLGEAGIELYDRGDYRGALQKFEQAERLVAAPTIGIRAARCLVKLRRLIDAARRYDAVAHVRLDPSWPAVHRQARIDAAKEREELLPIIPTLVISVAGAAPDRVSVDGKPVSSDELRTKLMLDPGSHRVVVTRGADLEEQTIELGEGDAKRALFFAPVAHARRDVTDRASPVSTVEPSHSSAWRTAGFVGIGVGGAGIVVGAVLAGLAISEKSDLDAACPDSRCPPAAWDQNDSYDSLRLGSTLGFAFGAASAAAGVLVLVTAPRPAKRSASASFHLTAAGIAGGF
jgi:hypothetical protein